MLLTLYMKPAAFTITQDKSAVNIFKPYILIGLIHLTFFIEFPYFFPAHAHAVIRYAEYYGVLFQFDPHTEHPFFQLWFQPMDDGVFDQRLKNEIGDLTGISLFIHIIKDRYLIPEPLPLYQKIILHGLHLLLHCDKPVLLDHGSE